MSEPLVKRKSGSRLRLWWVVALVAALSCASPGSPQAPTGKKAPDQAKLVAELRSADWTERASAVHALLGVPADQLTASVKEQVLQLYAAELKEWRETSEGQLSGAQLRIRSQEDFGEYFGYLGTLVLRIGGSQAWHLLIESPLMPMAEANRKLASQGTQVIPMIIDRLAELRMPRASPNSSRGPNLGSQMAMADILTDMVAMDQGGKLKAPLSPSDYTDIRRALQPLLDSANNFVRLYAAIALAKASDDQNASRIKQVFEGFFAASIPGERSVALDKILASVSAARFVPLGKVAELARSDPYHYLRTLPSGGEETVYPVRQRAREVLEKFRKLPAPGHQ